MHGPTFKIISQNVTLSSEVSHCLLHFFYCVLDVWLIAWSQLIRLLLVCVSYKGLAMTSSTNTRALLLTNMTLVAGGGGLLAMCYINWQVEIDVVYAYLLEQQILSQLRHFCLRNHLFITVAVDKNL